MSNRLQIRFRGLLGLVALSLVALQSRDATGLEYPRSGRAGCQAPLVAARPSSDAGTKIRSIADVSDGIYCTYSVPPSKEGHLGCRVSARSGHDRCYYSILYPTGGYHEVNYPVECFRSLLPDELQRFYGSHWLKVDAAGVADSCQFAAYPWRLKCREGRVLLSALPGTVTDRQHENGYTCRSSGTPYTFERPYWTSSSE